MLYVESEPVPMSLAATIDVRSLFNSELRSLDERALNAVSPWPQDGHPQSGVVALRPSEIRTFLATFTKLTVY